MKAQSVGVAHIRKDAAAKALGTAVYTGDVTMPGMLYGKALRSKYPSAKIIRIDTSAAERIPGVHAVITAKDIPGCNAFGLANMDQEVLA